MDYSSYMHLCIYINTLIWFLCCFLMIFSWRSMRTTSTKSVQTNRSCRGFCWRKAPQQKNPFWSIAVTTRLRTEPRRTGRGTEQIMCVPNTANRPESRSSPWYPTKKESGSWTQKAVLEGFGSHCWSSQCSGSLRIFLWWPWTCRIYLIKEVVRRVPLHYCWLIFI